MARVKKPVPRTSMTKSSMEQLPRNTAGKMAFSPYRFERGRLARKYRCHIEGVPFRSGWTEAEGIKLMRECLPVGSVFAGHPSCHTIVTYLLFVRL